MAVAWPGSLQEYINESGFGIQFGESAITTDMDVGPPKKRARSTRSVDVYDCTITIHRNDYVTFRNFYKTELNQGVSRFNYDHPLTGVETEFQFVSPPRIIPLGGEYFQVSMQWREIP